jgi:hypothetical protein
MAQELLIGWICNSFFHSRQVGEGPAIYSAVGRQFRPGPDPHFNLASAKAWRTFCDPICVGRSPALAETSESSEERIRTSLELFPCKLLFVHRDAEQEPLETRREEIRNAFSQAIAGIDPEPSTVCVVPVRMTEAWLLSSEAAIRAAAGNPLGRDEVHLPEPSRVESLPEPKDLLYETLRSASGLTGRRKQRLRVGALTHRVAELTGDFAALRQLRAFVALESELGAAICQNGWAES